MNGELEGRSSQPPTSSGDPWTVVGERLADLVTLCQQEQEALVRMDGAAVASISPRKQALLTALNQASTRVPHALTQSPPPAVRQLAQRCRRMNALNRRLLALTVNRMQALLSKLSSGGDSRYGQSTMRLLPGRIDSRV